MNTEDALRDRAKEPRASHTYRYALNIIQTMRQDYCRLFQVGEEVEVPEGEVRWENLE
jgi:hypothetical protein